MKYQLEVNDLKGFDEFSIELKLERGLYAITGTNGVGKSTLMSLLAKPFLPNVLDTYFGNVAKENSKVKYTLDSASESYEYVDSKWKNVASSEKVQFRGFYEGSVIHGTRFSDANIKAMKNASNVSSEHLSDADDFVREQLSFILHGYEGRYNSLKKIKHRDLAFRKYGFKGVPYFMEYEGKLVSQFSMSTGETLLISLLHFINNTVIRNSDKKSEKVIFIDEVELALHPSSLKRLINLLKKLSREYNLVVYFSTHSIELVRNINSENVYYLQPGIFSGIEVINPCFPAYATRSLYDQHDGYDFLILVEDELAQYIVKNVIDDNDLYHSKLVHVLPCSGWENTLRLHDDIVKSNLVGLGCAVMTFLDGDVKERFEEQYKDQGVYKDINVQFLPVKSVEKYLLDKLVEQPDQVFAKRLGDKFFRVRSLRDILADYRQKFKKDQDGKNLYRLLKSCAKDQRTEEKEFVTRLCEFIYEYDDFSRMSGSLKRILNG